MVTCIWVNIASANGLLSDDTKPLLEPMLAYHHLGPLTHLPLAPHICVSELHEPRIFYPSGHWPETVINAHVSAHFRQSLEASVISTHIRTEGLYVKTTIIYQLKRLCITDCAYTENMFINSIHISLYDISLTQNILYQIKRDVAVWKRLGCLQRNQRTWWQIVATPYTGLAGQHWFI